MQTLIPWIPNAQKQAGPCTHRATGPTEGTLPLGPMWYRGHWGSVGTGVQRVLGHVDTGTQDHRTTDGSYPRLTVSLSDCLTRPQTDRATDCLPSCPTECRKRMRYCICCARILNQSINWQSCSENWILLYILVYGSRFCNY